jgi:hypothetical protein
MEVFGSFIVNGFNGGAMGWGVGFRASCSSSLSSRWSC